MFKKFTPEQKAAWIQKKIKSENERKKSAKIVWFNPTTSFIGDCKVTWLSYKRVYPS